jgi:prolyl-tRNA synthetase
VPVVMELGPRDLASGNIVLKRRDTGTKEVVPQAEIAARLPAALEQMQKDLYNAAKQRLRDNTVVANSIGEVESILSDVTAEKGGGKFVMAHLKDDPACDARLKEFKATVRNIPLVDEFDGAGQVHCHGRGGGPAGGDRQGVLATRNGFTRIRKGLAHIRVNPCPSVAHNTYLVEDMPAGNSVRHPPEGKILTLPGKESGVE